MSETLRNLPWGDDSAWPTYMKEKWPLGEYPMKGEETGYPLSLRAMEILMYQAADNEINMIASEYQDWLKIIYPEVEIVLTDFIIGFINMFNEVIKYSYAEDGLGRLKQASVKAEVKSRFITIIEKVAEEYGGSSPLLTDEYKDVFEAIVDAYAENIYQGVISPKE